MTISQGHIFAAYLCDIYLLLVPGTFPRIFLGYILELYPWDNHIPAKWDPTQGDLTIYPWDMSFPHICAIYTCFLSQAHFPAYPWDIFLHYTLGKIVSLLNGIPYNDTKPYPWEISLLRICETYTCFSSLAHFPAYPWDTLYPRDNHIPAKWNTSVSHLLKFKKNVSNASGLRITRFEFYW